MKCTITNWPKCLKETNNANAICDNCAADGWIGGQEAVNAIANDPELSKAVGIVSPLQP